MLLEILEGLFCPSFDMLGISTSLVHYMFKLFWIYIAKPTTLFINNKRTKIDTFIIYFIIHIIKFLSMWYKRLLKNIMVNLIYITHKLDTNWYWLILNYVNILQFKNNYRIFNSKRFGYESSNFATLELKDFVTCSFEDVSNNGLTCFWHCLFSWPSQNIGNIFHTKKMQTIKNQNNNCLHECIEYKNISKSNLYKFKKPYI